MDIVMCMASDVWSGLFNFSFLLDLNSTKLALINSMSKFIAIHFSIHVKLNHINYRIFIGVYR